MKKSLIAMAVAGAMTVPAIAAADATLYGSFRVAMVDAKGESLELADNESRIGIMGTVDLGLQDTKGIFLWEQGLDLNEAALDDGRYAYVGATGSWGTAVAGKVDHPSVEMVSEYTDITYAGTYETVGSEYHSMQGNTLAYISPEFNGVTFVVGGVFAGDALSAEKDKTIDGYNMGVQYDAHGFYAAAAYGKVKSGKVLGDYTVDQNVWGLAAGFNGIENLDLRASYERLKDKTGSSEALGAEGKANAWNLSAQYDINDTAVYGQYGQSRYKPNAAANYKGESYTLGVAQTMGNGAVYAEFMDFKKAAYANEGRVIAIGYQLDF